MGRRGAFLFGAVLICHSGCNKARHVPRDHAPVNTEYFNDGWPHDYIA